MAFIDKLMKTMEIWIPDSGQINVEKGHTFERYIAEIFASQDKYFSIISWSADNHNKATGIKVEANKDPDLVIQYKPTKEKFAIECKYRSNPAKSKKNGGPVISWARPDQISHYKNFSKSNKIPVFVVIGLSGTPNSPDAMYCLPLEEAKYPELFFSLLNNYERDPKKSFFWRDGSLS